MKSAHSYEVEVKALLGNPKRADEVRQLMKKVDSSVKLLSRNKQLNHYFVDGNLATLAQKAAKFLLPEAANRLSDIVKKSKDTSVRTRDKDGDVLLVVKASIDDTTGANGIARLEFEEPVNMSLEELDALVKKAGYEYQAKWSREREEYKCLGVSVTLDRNAGYGWLAEFEMVVKNRADVSRARTKIKSLMKKMKIDELPQERLARMFEHYNAHWQKYYGTEKIFTVE
jgi:predicted adenylyl cyclase CyaB